MKRISNLKVIVSASTALMLVISCQKSKDPVLSEPQNLTSYREIERVVSSMKAVHIANSGHKDFLDLRVLWPDWASVVVCDLVGGAIGGAIGGGIGAVALGGACSAAAYGGLYGSAPASDDYPNVSQSTWPTWVENVNNPFDANGEDHNHALNFAADSSSVWMTVSGSTQTTEFADLLDLIESEYGKITPGISSTDLGSIAGYVDDFHSATLLSEYLLIISSIESDGFLTSEVGEMLEVIVEDLYYEDDPIVMVDFLEQHEAIIDSSTLEQETKEIMARAISICRYSIGYWSSY